MEETGLSDILIKSRLAETFHLYIEKERKILKKSHWFLFEASSNQLTTPEIEEKIIEVKWFSEDQLTTPLSNTFANIKLVVEAYQHLAK